MENSKNDNNNQHSSILDTIMGHQTQVHIASFEPALLVGQLLNLLKERDREIVIKRYGLDGAEIETLESIGKKYNLTRERVRQIEKDSINSLKKTKHKDLAIAHSLIFDTIIEHGSIMSEDFLLGTMLVGKDDNKSSASLKFLLCLNDQFLYFKETPEYWPSWYVTGFNIKRLEDVLTQFVTILKDSKKVIANDELFNAFKQSEYFKQHEVELSDRVLRSYLNISKSIQINPFSELGLKDWTEIKPRDVGDKAYLVLKHHGKPEHYSVITKLINEHKFDARQAYQETVHNELIKDSRFVLIGRGIYALTEWGYQKGVVADVIAEILKSSGKPMSREEIISEVMKKRLVKRNTILVGLSNKKLFQKVGKDRYSLAQTLA